MNSSNLFNNAKSLLIKNKLITSGSVSRFLSSQEHLSTSNVSGLDFDSAVKRLSLLKNDPGNEVKLQLYALFKQATIGKCNAPKPGLMDFVGKAKWQAWNEQSTLSKENAAKKYIDIVSSLIEAESPTVLVKKDDQVSSTIDSDEVISRLEGKIHRIQLNRPDKKNAIKTHMYDKIISALDEAVNNSSTMVVFTGSGDYFCSGNDLSNFMVDPSQMNQLAEDAKILLQKYVASFIDFPKPLIGIINGPAVGISVTVLGLFDAVYATDKATFHTPFSLLGQSPEGCSSYTFPKMMGLARASEMLLFNRKLTAMEAHERGLVTQVFPDHVFQQEINKIVLAFSQLPPQILKFSKQLIRNLDKDILHKVNAKECTLLKERWLSDECMNAILNYFQKKSSL